VQAVSKFMH